MLIAIPSKARATKQITWGNLPKRLKAQAFLFISDEDRQAYEVVDAPKIHLPILMNGIGNTRQAILSFCRGYKEDKVLMLDDDLTFAYRRDDEPTKFRTPTDDEIVEAVEHVENLLEEYAHVSIAQREGANRNDASLVENTRALRALAFRRDILEQEGIKFTDMEVMEDFYVQLSLLTRGYRHCTVNWMVQNQAGSNAPGGCSTYRTMEVQERAAKALAAKFPDFVKVVQKETKTAWGGQPRYDVIVSWKKAFEAGCRYREAKGYPVETTN